MDESVLVPVDDERGHGSNAADAEAGISDERVDAGAMPVTAAANVGAFALPCVNAFAVALLGAGARTVACIAPSEPLLDSLAVPSEVKL